MLSHLVQGSKLVPTTLQLGDKIQFRPKDRAWSITLLRDGDPLHWLDGDTNIFASWVFCKQDALASVISLLRALSPHRLEMSSAMFDGTFYLYVGDC
ncbi:MAG: hypothetical protein AAB343_01860 [Patescibacteria group bacterium]